MTRTRNEQATICCECERPVKPSGIIAYHHGKPYCLGCKPNMTAHTPTPWRVERTPATGSVYVLDGKNNPVCRISTPGDRGQQRAEEMCRAVNAHAGLVDKLDGILRWTTLYHGADGSLEKMRQAIEELARSALEQTNT